jgi:F-type H+-transporting ATPase subunit delta
MDKTQLTEVRQALERRTGKTILIQTKVKPEILGGVVARVGDKVIDGSVRHRLNALQQELLRGVANSNVDFSPEVEGIGITPAPEEAALKPDQYNVVPGGQ